MPNDGQVASRARLRGERQRLPLGADGCAWHYALPERSRAASPLKMQTKTGVDTAALAKAANEARGLAMDSIAAAHSGHLGLPLGCAEVRCEPGAGWDGVDSRDPLGHRCRAWTCTDIACIVQIGAVLYSDFLQHNPKDPQWLNRDRFVLSGGHGTLSNPSHAQLCLGC
jgi:transketolase